MTVHATFGLVAQARAANRKPTNRLILLASSAMLTMTIGAGQAWAAAEAPAPNEAVSEVVVTGTRIVQEGYQAPTPLTVVTAQTLQAGASANVAQTIIELPALSGNVTSQSNTATGVAATAGIDAPNLRNLGASRTLMLLDGRRVAPVNAADITDINSIPAELIQRVDVVTTGASAVYGSDAIGGVVNFILDKNFTGLKGEISGGETTYGDSQNGKFSLTYGTGFAGGKGHFLLAGEADTDNGVDAGARDWSRLGVETVGNPAYVAGNGQPQNLFLSGVGYLQAAPGGIIVSGPLKNTYFGAGGAPAQLNVGPLTSGLFMQGGDWKYTDLRPTGGIWPSEQRYNVFSRASYDVTDHLNVYAQVSYASTYTNAAVTYPYFVGTSSGPLIQIDNAYLPASTKAAMVANHITSFQLATTDMDQGVIFQNTLRKQQVYVLGATGDFDAFGKNWKWEAYAQDSEGNDHVEMPQNISVANYKLAADAVVNPATGAIVCRSTLTNPTNGCSPINVLGTGVNASNAPGLAFVHTPGIQNLSVGQTVFGASVTGEPFSDWAGPVSVAFDAEYRVDSDNAKVDAVSAAAGHVFGNYGAVDGSERVGEIAAETVVPLAKDLPWAQRWDLNAAVRLTHYNLFGDATTWKIGTTYSPIDDLKFRATVSRDIRAPNISEAFAQPATAKASLTDPATSNTVTFNQTTVGNANLVPEQATTYGVGVVYQPSYIKGFSASVDFWDTKIDNVIATLSSQSILNLCFFGTQPSLCNLIVRQGPSNGNGTLISVTSTTQNFNLLHVQGIDYEASYRLELSDLSASLPGSVSFHVNATQYLTDLTDTHLAPPIDAAGSLNEPRWKYLARAAYRNGPFAAGVTLRGFSKMAIVAGGIECTTGCPLVTVNHSTYSNNTAPAEIYADLDFSYDFDVSSSKATAFFNVRNLANIDPFINGGSNAFANGTTGGQYDIQGRVYRAGVRFQLP